MQEGTRFNIWFEKNIEFSIRAVKDKSLCLLLNWNYSVPRRTFVTTHKAPPSPKPFQCWFARWRKRLTTLQGKRGEWTSQKLLWKSVSGKLWLGAWVYTELMKELRSVTISYDLRSLCVLMTFFPLLVEESQKRRIPTLPWHLQYLQFF